MCTTLRQPVPTRVTTVAMVLVLLGTAGCMTAPTRVASPGRDRVAAASDATIAPANSECEEFFCER